MGSSLPPRGQRTLVTLAILLGVGGFLHVEQGMGHGATEPEAAPHVGHAAEEEREATGPTRVAWVVGGFAQVVLVGLAFLWPRRLALWSTAWTSAALLAIDALALAGTARIVLIAVGSASIVASLALVEARARGLPVIGLGRPSG